MPLLELIERSRNAYLMLYPLIRGAYLCTGTVARYLASCEQELYKVHHVNCAP